MTLSNEALVFAGEIASRFDARMKIDGETKNLLDARKKCISGDAVNLMLACSFKLDTIDGSNGAEHNVYALKCKLHNIVETLHNRDVLNHYTRALFLTARNLHANGEMLTQTDADCVCDATFKSKKSDTRAQAYVVTSTANKPSTNSTQKSSSLVTLVALNVLERHGKAFKFNSDAHATKLLEVALAVS
jgi:hypothetical protein